MYHFKGVVDERGRYVKFMNKRSEAPRVSYASFRNDIAYFYKYNKTLLKPA